MVFNTSCSRILSPHANASAAHSLPNAAGSPAEPCEDAPVGRSAPSEAVRHAIIAHRRFHRMLALYLTTPPEALTALNRAIMPGTLANCVGVVPFYAVSNTHTHNRQFWRLFCVAFPRLHLLMVHIPNQAQMNHTASESLTAFLSVGSAPWLTRYIATDSLSPTEAKWRGVESSCTTSQPTGSNVASAKLLSSHSRLGIIHTTPSRPSLTPRSQQPDNISFAHNVLCHDICSVLHEARRHSLVPV